MATNRRQKETDHDQGTDGSGFGGFFKNIEKLVELAASLKDSNGEIKKEGEINLEHLKKGMKGIFGFSVKSMAGNKPEVELFGNIKKSSRGPRVEESREPIVDIFDEEKELVVVVEMPGVNESDIKVALVEEDVLDVTTTGKEHKYEKKISLPSKVKADALRSSYRNGILEIRIGK